MESERENIVDGKWGHIWQFQMKRQQHEHLCSYRIPCFYPALRSRNYSFRLRLQLVPVDTTFNIFIYFYSNINKIIIY
jgi:hypothetical protein